jgi:KTSC domain
MHSLVDSSLLTSVAYSTDDQTLDLEFRAGIAYRYFDVPATLVDGLLAAESKGRYFNRYVRDRFRYQKQS